MADQPKQHSVFDFGKLALYATQGKAQLKFGIYRNNPRLVIFTNEQNDPSASTPISGNMDPYSFMSLLELLRTLIGDQPDTKYKIENFALVGEGREKSKSRVSDVLVGKDNAGVIWISVVADGRTKFKFEIGDFRYHKFYHGNGQELTKAEMSVLATKGMINLLSSIFSTYLTMNYEHFAANTFKGNKGNNRGSYGNQQRNDSSSVSDEDLPF